MNANPIIFTFTESPGSERYAVHAGGEISRPAIGMGPSGQWLFAGLARGGGEMLLDFMGVCERLADGEALPSTAYVRDIDGGTPRQHGARVASILLHPSRPDGWLGLVEKARKARLERERALRDTQAAERLETARKARQLVATVEGIEVRRKGDSFYVIEDESATCGLTFRQAAEALGAALIDRHS
jgi:hypothetical protein